MQATDFVIPGKAIDRFIKEWNQIRQRYYKQAGFSFEPASFEVTYGKKYAKLTADGSVYAFIDIKTGDIYKPEGWSKPAKHVRGNIHSDQHGLEAIGGPYSIRYLK